MTLTLGTTRATVTGVAVTLLAVLAVMSAFSVFSLFVGRGVCGARVLLVRRDLVHER